VNSAKLLRLSGVSKSIDGYRMLDEASLDIRSGQSCGIVSDSRDRLDLLIDIVSGAAKEDLGTIAYGGRELPPAERIRRVGVARDRIALIESLSVLSNLFLGSMRRYSFYGILRKGAMRRAAAETLKRLEAILPLDITLEEVDPRSRFFVDIARVLLKDCDFYIFDSVTRSMSVRQYEAFDTIARDLKARGKGVIIVPVSAQDIRNLVDRLFVLRGSQIFEIEGAKDLGDDELNDFFLISDKKDYKHIGDPIYKARRQIEERACEEDLDLHAIAESLFMSYDNFRRRFKAQIGISPNRYVQKMKVEKAKELLLYTDLEIKEIAERVGFDDPYYFSRVFKEWEDKSPLRFRGVDEA
jgi:ABC-type sugar transport system ATPase subunit